MKETHIPTLERLIATTANVSVLLTFISTVVQKIITWWLF